MPRGESVGFLALRERAYAFLSERGPATDDELLAHVYGGQTPAGLRAQLTEPLMGDPRLRQAHGLWTLAPTPLHTAAAVTALALATTGPNPARHRVLQLAARSSTRFEALLNPGQRVPGYVVQRVRLGVQDLTGLPSFGDVLDDLLDFLADRPVCAQDVLATWAFIEHAARRVGRTLRTPVLLDINALADALLDLRGKPTLALVAEHLGIGVVHVGEPADEARVIAAAWTTLLERATATGLHTQAVLDLATRHTGPGSSRPPLRRSGTARDRPDEPGVYRFRDADDAVLYVGKARRLGSRLQAYVHRPLGATRRFEGLAERVLAVETSVCATDLEALILEEREIRQLQPRYNTQRRQHPPRTWLRRPAAAPPTADRGKRQRALPRLLLSEGPADDAAAYLGPFRTQAGAGQARDLAGAAFGLDALRHAGDRSAYSERLHRAWQFLLGDESARDEAARRVRSQLATARAGHDARTARAAEQLLRAVLAYAPEALLLPADPRQARYAVVRPGPTGLEVFVVDAGILVGQAVVDPADASTGCAHVLDVLEPRTHADDRHVVLRWLGSQRPPARLVHLPDNAHAAHSMLSQALDDVRSALHA